ncbi:MAG: GspH/FimT family pseudopilin [Acidiferrobacterales bacterium]
MNDFSSHLLKRRWHFVAASGFTLIEMVVVMLLLVIIVSMVAINLDPDDRAAVRREAERLALLMQAAQQEAILQGQVFAVAFDSDGYHFLRLSGKGTLKPIKQDDVLRARLLPAGLRIVDVEIEGAQSEEPSGIVLEPSGDVPEFSVTLIKGEARWQVKGSPAAGILPADPREDHARS